MTSTSKLQTTIGAVAHATDGELRATGIGQEDVPSHAAIAEEEDVDLSKSWPNDAGFDTIREERQPINLNVEGTIPAYVSGSLIRNGPGGYQVKDNDGNVVYTRSHWFDAFSQLHRFDISHNKEDDTCKVTYRSRRQVDKLLESLQTSGQFSGYTFAQKRDPCQSLFWKVMAFFTPTPRLQADFTNMPITVSANTLGLSATDHDGPSKAGMLVTRSDESSFKLIDAETLEPLGIARQQKLHPLLTGPMSASHAKSDPDTGDVFNYNLDVGYKTVYHVFRTSASTGETDILASISSPEIAPAYVHSFFLSANFVILCIWNSHLAAGGMRVLWEMNVLDAMSPFDAAKPARWFVIDRRHGRGVVAKFESPAFFAFHTVNAWEDHSSHGGVDITCDVIEYDDLDVLHKYYYDNIRSSGSGAAAYMRERNAVPHIARYCLRGIDGTGAGDSQQTKGAKVEYGAAERIMTIPTPIAGELPTINMAFATQQYRYIYCCTSRSLSTFVDGLAKVDVSTGTSLLWDNPSGHTPSEAVFVADPQGVDEDEGVLLTIVLDGFSALSYLLCLDARTMTELGRADCRGPLPISFHGFFGQRGSNGELQRSIDA